MALSDFLTEGAEIPAGSALKSMVTQKMLPEWYTNYAMQLLANQAAVGQSPYTPYSAPRIAGFTPDQSAGFDATRAAAGSYQPGLAAAGNTLNTAAGMSSVGAAQPLFDQALSMDPSAAAAGDINTARGLVGSTAGMSGMSAASPFFGTAMGALGGAMASGGGMATAMPWLNKAGGDLTDVSAYMNPYTDAVVNRIGELGQRNLMDKIMPGLEGRYIKSGQFQGSGQMTDTMRAVRDTASDILGAQSTALQQGYGAAQTAKGTDLSRYGTMAGTAGQVGQNWMDALLKGADTSGALGKSAADIMGADRSGALSTASAYSALGSQVAGLTAAQQKMLSDMGINLGTMTGNDATRLAGLAGQQAGLAGQTQSLGLTGAGALSGIGDIQQKGNQANLDLAYQDFLKQQGYPQAQIDAMLGTYKGLGTTMPEITTEHGILPSGVQPQYEPGTAASIGSALTGLGGLLSGAHDAGIF